MKVLSTRVSTVSVEVTRSVTVGGTYNMSGSYGYAGIDNGQVKVIAIGHVEDLYANTQLNPGISSAIESHIEAEVDNSSEGTVREELDSCLWVVYVYKTIAAVEEEYVLPLELFLEHTSIL